MLLNNLSGYAALTRSPTSSLLLCALGLRVCHPLQQRLPSLHCRRGSPAQTQASVDTSIGACMYSVAPLPLEQACSDTC